MKYLTLLICFITTLILASCEHGPQSPKGFSLPKGDVVAGKQVFFKYQCLACHTLKGIEQQVEKELQPAVRLGGKTTVVKTYADLVTSVINPSHKITKHYPKNTYSVDGKSTMKIYNDVMTVTELVDLVTFLQPHYKLMPYEETHYRYMP
jgi:mono/diheme cytochrome c family protein